MDSVILDPEEEQKLLELLALRSAGVAPRKLLELFTLREELPRELPLGLPTGLDCYQEELERTLPQAEEELALCRHTGISILPFFSPSYPNIIRKTSRQAQGKRSVPNPLSLRRNEAYYFFQHSDTKMPQQKKKLLRRTLASEELLFLFPWFT
nr:MAG TPA: hypothetical protein [Caudoviricetes sp.]